MPIHVQSKTNASWTTVRRNWESSFNLHRIRLYHFVSTEKLILLRRSSGGILFVLVRGAVTFPGIIRFSATFDSSLMFSPAPLCSFVRIQTNLSEIQP